MVNFRYTIDQLLGITETIVPGRDNSCIRTGISQITLPAYIETTTAMPKFHIPPKMPNSILLTPKEGAACVVPVDAGLDAEPTVVDDPLLVPPSPPLLVVPPPVTGVLLPPVTPALVSPQAPVNVARSFALLSAAGVDPQLAAWVIQIALFSKSKTAVSRIQSVFDPHHRPADGKRDIGNIL